MFSVFVFPTNLILSIRYDFFYSIRFEKLSLRNRWLIKKIILFYVKLSLTTTIKRGNLGHVRTNLFQIADCVSVPTFVSFCWSYLVAFGEITFQKLVTNQLFGLEIRAVRQDTFYPHQDYEQGNFYKKWSQYSLGWPFRNRKNAA